MANLLRYSIFSDVMLPQISSDDERTSEETLTLRRSIRYQLANEQPLAGQDLVVFDFETTGLDARQDRIIEIGAIRLRNFEPIAEFSSLIDPSEPLNETVIKLTGITNEMLVGQPKIEDVLGDFLEFIEGSLLVAHNAEFDMAFLVQAAHHLGIDLSWPAFCTLKMARVLLPELESKNLDSLAEYFNLGFEARHRSIGDVKVTCGVLRELLNDHAEHIKCWADVQPYWVTKS